MRVTRLRDKRLVDREPPNGREVLLERFEADNHPRFCFWIINNDSASNCELVALSKSYLARRRIGWP